MEDDRFTSENLPTTSQCIRLFFSAADDRLFAISDGQIFRCSINNFGLTLSETVQIQEPKEDLVIRDYTGAPTGRYLRDITTNTTDGRFFVAAAREKYTDSTGSLVTGGRQVILWDMHGSTRQRYSFSVHEKYTVGLEKFD